MANLKEQSKWEEGIYQLEENDPVVGGEDGISNKQAKQLANRTTYLKQELEKPATTEQVGRTQLADDLTTNDNTKALTAKQGLTLKGFIDSLTRSLGNYIPNSKKSDAINSPSSDTVATSAAAKTAYDKGVSALNEANKKLDKSGGVATGGITAPEFTTTNGSKLSTAFRADSSESTDTGRHYIYSTVYSVNNGNVPPNSYRYGVGMYISGAGTNADIYFPHREGTDADFWLRTNFNNDRFAKWTHFVSAEFMIGIPIPYPKGDVPAGFLAMNGQRFSPTNYPELAKKYPNNQLPDLRGEFIRGWDNGRGVDRGRGILSSQSDDFKSHSHTPPSWSGYGGLKDSSDGAYEVGSPVVYSQGKDKFIGGYDYAGRIPPTTNTGGSETRPRNVAFQYICLAG